jgi:hypothetical protein
MLLYWTVMPASRRASVKLHAVLHSYHVDALHAESYHVHLSLQISNAVWSDKNVPRRYEAWAYNHRPDMVTSPGLSFDPPAGSH